MHRSLFPAPLATGLPLLAACAALIAASTAGATPRVLGTERHTGDIYEIDLSDGSSTLLGTAPLLAGCCNPNGNAYDAAGDRLYYTSFGSDSHLYSYDFAGNHVDLGALAGRAGGGSFFRGSYYYIPNGQAVVSRVTPAADGLGFTETWIDIDFDGFAARTWSFGDIAIDENGILYGSGSGSEFFSIDLLGGTTLTSVVSLPMMQIAFGSDGQLYGHSTGSGLFFEVDPDLGTRTSLGVTAWGTLGDGGFTDLAGAPAGSMPEPTSLVLFGAGAVVVCASRRRGPRRS